MACPISHIIYARKYLEKRPLPNGDEELFILGTVFPDIRRIDDEITRRETHLCFDPVDLNFKNLTPFQAGWKFHLYCDMKREEILNQADFYSLEGTVDNWGLSAKFLEDTLAYENFNNWEKLTQYFNHAPDITTGVNVSRETFYLWFAILSKYMEKKPDMKSISVFLSKQAALANKAKDIVAGVDKIGRNDKIVKILKEVRGKII